MARGTRDRPLVAATGLRAGSARVAVGDYLCSERDLYRVEQLADGRALLEDCRTGDLVDAPFGELSRLRRVDRS
jgi:hypothetical protein